MYLSTLLLMKISSILRESTVNSPFLRKTKMTFTDVLTLAKHDLTALDHHLIDVVDVMRPPTLEYAKNLAKVISKLSSLLGNMIEFSTIDLLNKRDWKGLGTWVRQDPGFPDALFQSELIQPNPGIEYGSYRLVARERYMGET